ncbi:MAG: hypothetical protein H7Y36_06595 [Armatimonadetes bacterium]|nr:hypothetical protein [Akkermansiaceae bacterium]
MSNISLYPIVASPSLKLLIPRLSILLLAFPVLCAQETRLAGKKSPISLLPNGSVLKGVLLPRYDANRNLVGDLKAETMTLIDADRVQGQNVLIKFYNPDHSLRGKVVLSNALFDQAKSRLYANEPVEITSDRLLARGTGLVYAFQDGRGFLRGPASTTISEHPAISMNSRTLPTTALIALCFAPLNLPAAPPPFTSEAELAAIKADAETLEPALDKANQSAESALIESQESGKIASAAARDFIKTSEIKNIAAESEQPEPDAKPLDVEPGPDVTLINCDGGMYFDANAGVLVYLNNVRVTDPRFTLTGANELKVFFTKKPEDKPKVSKKKNDLEIGGGTTNFSEVERIVATGAVRLLQKGVAGKEPVEASGGILTYNIPKGEIIISERFPWVKQGTFYARAKEPNLTLRLLNDGSFSTQGNWEMGGNLNLKR